MASLLKGERTGDLENLILWINNWPDMLTAIAVHYGGVKERMGFPVVSKIEADGFDLHYDKIIDGKNEIQTVKIKFEPGLSAWTQARPRIIHMRAVAEKSLAVPKYPKLPPFTRPAFFPWVFIILIALLVQVYFLLAPVNPGSYTDSIRDFFGGMFGVKASYVLMITLHLGEGYYVNRLAAKHGVTGTDLFNWTLWTVMFGWATFTHIQRTIQNEKIESIYRSKRID